MANNKTTYDNKQIETTTTDNNSFKNNISATDVSILSNDIINKNIDTTIYLDYQTGINTKKYKWIKSNDNKYFTLAYINGNPVKTSEAKNQCWCK